MPITSLNINDVLIGRGSGPNKYIGNKRFRQHVGTRREEYQAASTVREKVRIAQEVVDHIHSLGGRFVVQVLKGEKVGDILVNGEWQEEDRSVAEEKAKQSLRERKGSVKAGHQKKEGDTTKRDKKDESPNETPIESNGVVPAVSPVPLEWESSQQHSPTSSLLNPQPNPATNASWNPSLAAPMFLGSTLYPAVDARLLLFQSGLGLQQPQPLLASSAMHQLGQLSPFPVDADHGLSQATLLEQYVGATRLQQQGDNELLSPSPDPFHQTLVSKKHQRTDDTNVTPAFQNAKDEGVNEEIPTEYTSSPNEPYSMGDMSKEDEAAAFVLSSLAIKDRPVITYEQMEHEKAAQSDEQQAAALADMFGAMNINDHVPTSKKTKRDLDRSSVGFLIRRMRFHIERTPESKKEALTEAQRKCRLEEFSDARLEQFLRCEGMNAELAAHRFVGYWEKRKETFGKDKFTLRLTLSEALRDDTAALEAAVYSLLPRRDLSGRQLMYLVPPNNAGEGYSPDSMVRAMWYVAEVAAAQNTDARSGVVEVTWHKECSLWDYNPRVYDRLIVYLQCYWPIRNIAAHVCCPPKIFVRWLFPILNALTDPFMRSRVQVHDVPPTEIANTLSEYGIGRDMLPTEMGGTLELNPSEWIAQRRAAEMEEL